MARLRRGRTVPGTVGRLGIWRRRGRIFLPLAPGFAPKAHQPAQTTSRTLLSPAPAPPGWGSRWVPCRHDAQAQATRGPPGGARIPGRAVRRSPAKPGQPGRPPNKLSSAQVDALHGVYLCGTAELGRPWSLPEIAAVWWLPLGYSTPKAAAEGIRREFKRHGLTLRSPSEAAKLSVQDRGTRPPPSELTDWLERRRRLLLKGLRYRRKSGYPFTISTVASLTKGDGEGLLDVIGHHFGRDARETFAVAVEFAAISDPNGPPAAPHIAVLGAAKRESTSGSSMTGPR